MAEIIKGVELEKPVREPYVLHDIEELIHMNGLDAISEGPPVDMDSLVAKADMKPAVFIKDGKYRPDLSESACLYGGSVTDEKAGGVRIVSYSPSIGGIYAEGAGTYTVENSAISLSGDGMGLGGRTSGVAVSDNATLIVKNCVVDTVGANRCASSAGQHSVLKVEDSVLISHGAPYGDDAPNGGYTDDGPPAPLEILGNCRTHCTVDNSYSYFDRCKVVCDGWAALSTDASMGFVYLEANDCDVYATKNGYGAYADFCCHDKFKNCRFHVAKQGIIMGGQATGYFEDCRLDCGTYLALIHCVMGTPVEVGELTLKNCTVKCGAEAVKVRSQNAIIDFTNSVVESDKGILVASEFNADPFTTKVRGAKVYGIHVNLNSMLAKGDIIHADHERSMTVNLRSTVYEGAVKNANLTMDRGSRWTATGDSQVVFGCDIDLSQIDAPEGVCIKARGASSGEYALASGGRLVVE